MQRTDRGVLACLGDKVFGGEELPNLTKEGYSDELVACALLETAGVRSFPRRGAFDHVGEGLGRFWSKAAPGAESGGAEGPSLS